MFTHRDRHLLGMKWKVQLFMHGDGSTFLPAVGSVLSRRTGGLGSTAGTTEHRPDLPTSDCAHGCVTF